MLRIVRRTWAGLVVVAVGVGLGGCGDDPVDVVVFEVIEELTFAANLGVELDSMEMLSTGVYIRDLVVGTGDLVEVGSTAVLTYSGWLADGTLFDDGTISPVIGVGALIDGFDDGVLGMRVGGTRLLVIPPSQGYGANAIGLIPAGSVLVFQVTVDSVS